MIVNLKDAAWKQEALRVHALLEQELSKGLDRVWVKTMAYQKALQVMGKLNGFIETEATEASYQHRHAELFELCAELQIKDRVIEKIQVQFGPECFFIESLCK